jgi:hypothetical protein
VSDGIEIDWQSAEVRDARLTVAFGDSAPKQWVSTVEDVVERLGRAGHSWGEVEVTKKRLRVADVRPGSEESLRHFLESALLQANSGLEDGEDAEADHDLADEDRQMTETFRSFAA